MQGNFLFSGEKALTYKKFCGCFSGMPKIFLQLQFLKFWYTFDSISCFTLLHHVLMKKMHRNLYISRESTFFEDFVQKVWDLGFVCKYGIFTDSMSAHDARIVSWRVKNAVSQGNAKSLLIHCQVFPSHRDTSSVLSSIYKKVF